MPSAQGYCLVLPGLGLSHAPYLAFLEIVASPLFLRLRNNPWGGAFILLLAFFLHLLPSFVPPSLPQPALPRPPKLIQIEKLVTWCCSVMLTGLGSPLAVFGVRRNDLIAIF